MLCYAMLCSSLTEGGQHAVIEVNSQLLVDRRKLFLQRTRQDSQRDVHLVDHIYSASASFNSHTLALICM
jgi:hypothetical protein